MDKKSIIGIAVVALLFFGFAYFNTQEQKKYQEEMAAWQAYQDSVALATRPVVPVADSVALTASWPPAVSGTESATGPKGRVASATDSWEACQAASSSWFVLLSFVLE